MYFLLVHVLPKVRKRLEQRQVVMLLPGFVGHNAYLACDMQEFRSVLASLFLPTD